MRQIPEIVALGISGLKIEGRYKDAAYVTLTTRAYRTAVDEACAGRTLSVSPLEETQLEQVYSRGLGPWFLTGTNHQTVVKGRSPRHRGVRMGHVVRVDQDAVVVDSTETVKPGDGVVFDAADWRSPQEPEEGGRVYEVERLGGLKVELRFGNGVLNTARIRVGDLIWRTHDPAIDKAVRALPAWKQPVCVKATARVGEPLVLDWAVGTISVRTVSPEVLPAAQNRALGLELLTEQLGRLGNTPYHLAGLELDVEGSPFAPASLLNQLRRQAVELLTARQSEPRDLAAADPQAALARMIPRVTSAETGEPRLHLLVRTPEQLEAALTARPASHHARLSGSLRPPSVARTRESGGNRSPRGQSSRAEAGRGAHRRIFAQVRLRRSWFARPACWMRLPAPVRRILFRAISA